MAGRLSKEQIALKIKGANKAFEELKEDSAPVKNLATPDRVVALTNEKYSEGFDSPLSRTTLISPSSEEFKKLKARIDAFKMEHKKNKSLVPKKSKKENTVLNEQVSYLVAEIAKITDEKMLEIEKSRKKDRTIKKLESEINALKSRLSECEKEG